MAGGIRIGWTGKLPCRGDFVTGGVRLAVFEWFDAWASEGMVAVRDGGGPAADGFLTSDLVRIAAAGGVLGPAPVLAVIGPGMDRAARLYPFMIAAELGGNISPPDTIEAAAHWYAQVEELFLDALAPDFQPDRMESLTAGLPAPHVPAPHVPEPEGAGLAFGASGGQLAVRLDPPPFASIFRAATIVQPVTGGRTGQLMW